MISGGKIGEILWMESGVNLGKARSTSNKANPQIKFNKIPSHQQIKKKLGLFLWGNFRIRTKNNKTKLKTKRGGSEIMINVAHDTKMM